MSSSWLWDTANSRLVTQGTTYTDLLLTGVSCSDVEVMLISDQIQECSLIMRQLASNNRYYIAMSDNSGSWGGVLDVRRITPGDGDVRLTGASIDFVRGTFHALHVVLIGSRCTVWFDGIQLYSYVDGSPINGSGSVGLNRGTGTSHINDLAIRPLGQDAMGVNVYTKTSLTSTNALESPKVKDLVACVRHPFIATGAVIPQTDFAYKKSVAAALDEVASSSQMGWRLNESYQVVMQPRDGQFAPFVLSQGDGGTIEGTTMPKVSRQSPTYRNRQYVTGAVDLVEEPESKLGNGVDTSWSLDYAIDSILSISMGGQTQTFGIKDTDTGRTFYYTKGEKTLSLDGALNPPTAQIDVVYIARKDYRAMAQDTGQQAIIAVMEGSSGIVEASESIDGLSKAAADAKAAARLAENARLAITLSLTTRQSGLAPGQLVTVVIPKHALLDLQLLITSVSTQVRQQTDGTLLYWYAVEATSGPSLGNWSRALSLTLIQKGSG